MPETVYSLPDTLDAHQLLSNLDERFRLVAGKPATAVVELLDSFDWRVFSKGFLLARQGGTYTLRPLRPSPDPVVAGRPAVDAPTFWQDFVPGPLQEALRQALDIRALMRLAEVRRKTRPARLLNEDDKTVLRLNLEEATLGKGKQARPVGRALTLSPLKGYDREAAEVAEHLAGLGLTPRSEGLLLSALREAGLEPGGYSSKLAIQLDPQMPAREAATKILKRLAGVIRANEQGIREDIDTEFLHDFRVSVRRTRAALAQIKRVFPGDRADAFAAGFRRIGKLTNRPRDLDVYLLKRDSYRSLLPGDLADALEPMFDGLKAERMMEYRKLSRALKQGWYLRHMESWLGFLDECPGAPSDDARDAGTPIGQRAERWIRRRYRKVLRLAGGLQDEAPDSAFHTLRIECKKLRYLMEFFCSLYPQDEVQRFIAQLKRLQDNLGEYNDLAIQQEDLRGRLEAIAGGKEAAAVGGLITVLNRQQTEIRQSFRATFEAFAGKENSDRFQVLFARSGQPNG